MSLKKTLGIMTIFIVFMFFLVLSTSYAWYSFERGSTTFNTVTSNDDITITYESGMYIENMNAIPITSDQIDKYSDKNKFSIDVNNEAMTNNIMISIRLVDIVFGANDNSYTLKNSNFKYDLFMNGTSIANGNFGGFSGTSKVISDNVLLDSMDTNDFELRLYLLDNGNDQTNLENCDFRGKLSINVVSRLKTTLDKHGPDIYVSNISIDGATKSYIPTTGYYDMTYTCTKGSSLSWDTVTKTITYSGGSKVNDSCSLTFTTPIDKSKIKYPYLSSIAKQGDYVAYIGNNGCEGAACSGQNANYVSETNMGYCFNSDYKFISNGWRILDVSGGTAYLVSGGAPECYGTYIEDKSPSTSTHSLTTNYYYGSGYYLNPHTGYYELTGVTSSAISFSSNRASIVANTPYTCKKTSKPVAGTSIGNCETMYKIDDISGNVYIYTTTYTNSVDTHINNLNVEALKYCNSNYAYNGVCDVNSAWAFRESDYQKVVGNSVTLVSCLDSSSITCGAGNDLIDNGGYYWIATNVVSSRAIGWIGYDRRLGTDYSYYTSGFRPVLRLKSSIYVTDGNGTYEDPYIISY